MNYPTLKNGTFDSAATFAAAARAKQEILNPTPPRPKVDAVVIKVDGRLFAGKRRSAGELVAVWPETPPADFVSKSDAREWIDNGYAEAATPEQIEAWLAANETPTTDHQ